MEDLLCRSKKATLGHYDELRGGISNDEGNANSINVNWTDFFKYLGHQGLDDFDLRTNDLTRQVRDNGITYNVYADQNGPQRPWSLDLFPLIISSADWKTIQEGVLQRAQLLENIISDVYGPQSLLQNASLPPALVLGHPGYIRAIHGVNPAGNKHLHIIAFDLAKTPNGNWAVLSQRTQAPSGLGYLLENRSLISRQFPNAYDEMHIEPIAGAYRQLIESLKQLSPAKGNAHVALLTPGPYNETYFEQAYLARYLGLTLVEGGDLTVRDQKLYLRTLRGLEPVDVLIKRLDDEYLDPLELRSDSTLGIPGLLQVVRAGNVILANSPGSAFLESPALLGFLPGLSELLLKQELLLPAMDTWWCGERAAMDLAIPELKHSTIKPTYPKSSCHETFLSILGSTLSQPQLDEWVGRITRQPDAHTIQTYIPLGQMPTWKNAKESRGNSGIEPRSFMLRVFALSNGPDSWYVVPGGLVRIANQENGIASMQRGGSSADVWVRTDSQLAFSTAPHFESHAPVLSERKRLVTSRAAENLYWFGRYTERSENTLRLVRLGLESLNSEHPSSPFLWNWLEKISVSNGLIPDGVPSTQSTSTIDVIQQSQSQSQSQNGDSRHRIFERTLVSCLNQTDHITSVGFNLSALKNSASSIRERLSPEQWNTIEQCLHQFKNDCENINLHQEYSSSLALESLLHVSTSLAAITGAQTDRMTRDDGWQLLSIGRHIERFHFLSSCLDQAILNGLLDLPPEDGSGFTALLALFDSTITFQAQYQQSRELPALIDLLVLDNENPRSLAWVAKSMRSRLSKLAGTPFNQPDSLGKSVPSLHLQNAILLSTRDSNGFLTNLLNCLRQSDEATWHIANTIESRYFSHTQSQDYSARI